MKSKTVIGKVSKRRKSYYSKASLCICKSVSVSPSFPTETLPGVLPDRDRRQLLRAARPDPGSDRGPGGAAAPGQNRDRGPEAGIRAAPGHQGPPGKRNRDLLPPHRRRGWVGKITYREVIY